MTHPSSGIVFLLGVAPRSGTNFLEQLLALHPDCSPGVPLREDHVLHHSELLDAYVERLSDRWSRQPHWGVHAGLAEALRSHLGAGLSQFLRAQIEPPGLVDEVPEVMSDVHRLVKPSSRYLIAKTPRVSNLRNWLRYFPAAPAVILVRDGRSVAESTVRSWGSNWESVVQDWAQAAQTIIDFRRAFPEDRQAYRVVRYEDLLDDLEAQLDGVFELLGLDASRYDLASALDLPVRGSSSSSREGRPSWDPVTKTEEFDPKRRWSSWTRAQHERFNWVAGRQSEAFGYRLAESSGNEVAWQAWNRVMDARWVAMRNAVALVRRVRR